MNGKSPVTSTALALVAHPNDRNILEALASFHEARSERASAKNYTDRLRVLSERNKQP